MLLFGIPVGTGAERRLLAAEDLGGSGAAENRNVRARIQIDDAEAPGDFKRPPTTTAEDEWVIRDHAGISAGRRLVIAPGRRTCSCPGHSRR